MTSNVTVEANAVIRHYRERLMEANHAIVMLESRLEVVEAQLEQVQAEREQAKEAGVSKPTAGVETNGSGSVPSSLSVLPESPG